MEYLPFGETLADEHLNSHNSPFKFNGKEYDEETGNYYYGARYYDPKLSIFISVDPLVEDTMDAYGYCYQNPINLVDPTGMSADPPPSDLDTAEGTVHKDSSGTWIYDKAGGGIWRGQNGARDIENSIGIKDVVINATRETSGSGNSTDWFSSLRKEAYEMDRMLYGHGDRLSWGNANGGTTIWGADRSGDTGGIRGSTRDSFNYDEFIAPAGGGGNMTFWKDQKNVGLYMMKALKDNIDGTSQGNNIISGLNNYATETIKEKVTVKQYRIDLDTKTYDSVNVTRHFKGPRNIVNAKIDSTKNNSKQQRRNTLIYFNYD